MVHCRSYELVPYGLCVAGRTRSAKACGHVEAPFDRSTHPGGCVWTRKIQEGSCPLAPFAFRFNLSSVLEDKKPFPKDAAYAPKTRSFVIYTYDDRPPNDESQDQDRDEIVTDMEAGRYGFAKWVEPRRIGARIQTYRR